MRLQQQTALTSPWFKTTALFFIDDTYPYDMARALPALGRMTECLLSGIKLVATPGEEKGGDLCPDSFHPVMWP